jgi:hypothetical protein
MMSIISSYLLAPIYNDIELLTKCVISRTRLNFLRGVGLKKMSIYFIMYHYY